VSNFISSFSSPSLSPIVSLLALIGSSATLGVAIATRVHIVEKDGKVDHQQTLLTFQHSVKTAIPQQPMVGTTTTALGLASFLLVPGNPIGFLVASAFQFGLMPISILGNENIKPKLNIFSPPTQLIGTAETTESVKTWKKYHFARIACASAATIGFAIQVYRQRTNTKK